MSVLLLNVTIDLRNNFQQFFIQHSYQCYKAQAKTRRARPSSYFPFQGNGGAVDGQV